MAFRKVPHILTTILQSLKTGYLIMFKLFNDNNILILWISQLNVFYMLIR